MKLRSLPQLARNTGRFKEVVEILVKYGLAPWIGSVRIEWMQQLFRDSDGQDIRSLSQAVRIRKALTELGILSAALFVGSALLWSQEVPPLLGGYSIPGALGCLAGVLLGLRLLLAIKRSGNIEVKP